MKLITKTTVLVLFLLSTFTYSQMSDDWEWMNPKPQGNSIYAVDFVNDNTGFAAGDFGTMIKTNDNGTTWTKVQTGTSRKFLSMDFVDLNTGYAGGDNQHLQKTINGGQSWQVLNLPREGQFDSLFYIRDIHFINQNLGYVLGFFLMESKIWKTTDGGNSWQTQTTGGANYLYKLTFWDANNGIAVGGSFGGEIIKTTNGGATWQIVYQLSYQCMSVKYLNANTVFAGCEEGRMYRSTDGGTTWNFVLSDAGIDFMSINFTSANTGFAFGSGSAFAKTIDGGSNWVEHILSNQSSRQYFDADVTPSGSIHALGSYGATIRSTNAGATFVSQAYVTEGYISDIKFVDVNTGYAVAGYSGGDILKTTNSGATWVSQITGYTLPIYGIAFINAETGFLAGSLTVYKTTNGGTNWQTVHTSGTNEIFTDVFFINPNTGFVSGSYGKLLKTTNAGASWSPTVVPGVGMLSSLDFLNENTGFSIGDNNAAIKTTNGGVNWSPMSVPAPANTTLNNIFFVDNNTGYISSSAGIFKTTNAGGSWIQLPAPAGGYNNVQFRGSYGYAIAGDGKIIKSINAGASWIIQPTVTANPLYALYFNTDNYVYVGGILGTMLKTMPTELLMTPVTGNNSEIPKSFYVSQNYPNPFNPSTTIKFGLSKQSSVNITIYDIAGRKVEELLRNEMNAGTYEVKWNASNYSSGVYFYSITTADFRETKKMLLVK